jgi:hypothetical protein
MKSLASVKHNLNDLSNVGGVSRKGTVEYKVIIQWDADTLLVEKIESLRLNPMADLL